MSKMNLILSPAVKAALQENRPVVALESTLITHGFPHPQNLEVARALEEMVRREGAVPATIAVLKGQLTVGLRDDQLAYLANSAQARKCSVRDLPLVTARGEDGSTTVAATMVIAHRAGIRIFATGGIGGVHRGHSLDISADLMELGRTPITVVCAGMKAFLDLPASLEYLETQAVPVLGYQTDEFPAFYSRTSGLPVDMRVNSAREAAQIIHSRDALGLPNAVLLAVPIPPADEWPAREAESIIRRALAEAEARHISGKDITPFLLARIAELSDGRSMRANIALLEHNARVAAQVAAALPPRTAT